MKIEAEIVKIIKSRQQTFWPDLNRGIPAEPKAILAATRRLINEGVIRLREDRHEHAHEYTLPNAEVNPSPDEKL